MTTTWDSTVGVLTHGCIDMRMSLAVDKCKGAHSQSDKCYLMRCTLQVITAQGTMKVSGCP